MGESYITTSDNPFDFWTEYSQWFAWDAAHGYNTPGLIARVLVTSSNLSDADQAAALDIAIDQVLEANPNGMLIRTMKE